MSTTELPDEAEELLFLRVVQMKRRYNEQDRQYEVVFAVLGIGPPEFFYSYHDAILCAVNASAKALLRR